MNLEGLTDSDIPMAIPLMLPVEGGGGILEALSSNSSRNNEEYLNSILRMASLNANLASGVMQSTIIKKYSTSVGVSNIRQDAPLGVSNLPLPMGVYFQNNGSNNKEPYFSLSSSSMSFSHDDPVNGPFSAENFPDLSQSLQKAGKFQEFGNTKAASDLFNFKSQIYRESPPFQTKQELDPLAQITKTLKYDVNQENIQLQELLLKELQERNPQLKSMLMQQRLQNQLHQQVLDSGPRISELQHQLPKPLIRCLPQEPSNQQVPFTPLLDGGICSRRFMQYLYHVKNRPHDNNFTFWKKLVFEYYAPSSKKRWCFSSYENFEQNIAGVFTSSSKEAWCCDLCGSSSGKGLEGNFEIFPRLFKVKFESGMLDEILFLELPRARTLPSGLLLLEYGRAIQESVYENFRVVHEGKLRIIFRQDLKILSWEFCAKKHEEFLPRGLVAPQVDQLLQAAQKYHSDVENGVRAGISSAVLRADCNLFVAASQQLARTVELPLVNDLGYPKKFIRCLQIAGVVNSMRDLIGFSHDQKMGPIETKKLGFAPWKRSSIGTLPPMPFFYDGGWEFKMHEAKVSGCKVPNYGKTNDQKIALWQSDNQGSFPRGKISFLPESLNEFSKIKQAVNQMKENQGKEHLAEAQSAWMLEPPPGFPAHGPRITDNSVGKTNLAMKNACDQSLGQSSSSASSKRRKVHESRVVDASHQSKGSSSQSFDSLLLNNTYQNSSPTTQPPDHNKSSHQAAIDKLIAEMVAMSGKPSNESVRRSYKNSTFSSLLSGTVDSQDACTWGNRSNSSKKANVPKVGSRGNFPAVSSSVIVKAEPYSPEDVPETVHGSTPSSSKSMDFEW